MPSLRSECLPRVVALVAVLSCVGGGALGQPPGEGRDDSLAARRFALMKARVAAAQARSDEAGFPAGFAAEPVFNYSDPTRGYVSAAVWKLGDRGRPRALLATELDRSDHGKPCISYEFASLTRTPFTLHSDDIRWSPAGTDYQFRPIPKAPPPGKTLDLRTRQLREIARRFASREEVKGEKCELRLLPTPVDRYTPSSADRSDGAIFLFTFGTNPEVVLLIESDGVGWSYAAGRLTGAQMVVLSLDDVLVWEGAPLAMTPDAPFTGSITPVDIPGIAPDGTEIRP